MIATLRLRGAQTPALTQALYVLAALLSGGFIAAAWQDRVTLPLNKVEVLAFVSGAWTVWLAARNHALNWPIGVLSVFFVSLFWEARLYFDMSLNIFYVGSGLWGWWLWSLGGRGGAGKPIGRLRRTEGLAIGLVGAAITLAMWQGGVHINDSAPFLDALTTALSIGAQWLMMRRVLEHWFLWIAADLVYVPLYLSRDLPLTAVLYGVFLLMCLRGVLEWRRVWTKQREVAVA